MFIDPILSILEMFEEMRFKGKCITSDKHFAHFLKIIYLISKLHRNFIFLHRDIWFEANYSWEHYLTDN